MNTKPLSISEFGTEYRQSGDQLNYKHCPVCGSSAWKLYVNPQSGFWFCHAGGHQGGGKVEGRVESHISDEAAQIMRLLDGDQPAPVEWPEIQLPKWGALSRTAWRYLDRRGVRESTAKACSLVEQLDEGRIIIPYFDHQGRLIYYNSRGFTRSYDGPKYKAAAGRHPLYVPDYCDAKQLVIVEGAFDAIKVRQYTGQMAVALGGKNLPRYLKGDLLRLVRPQMEVVIMLDGDALGDAIKLSEFLYGARIVQLDPGEDPADATKERLLDVL